MPAAFHGVLLLCVQLLMGGDWFKESPQQLMNSITAPPYPGYPLPKALHINGKSLCSGLQYFTVKPGCWYRMRIINTAMWASFNLKIEVRIEYRGSVLYC